MEQSRLSKHFTVTEFQSSMTAERRGIRNRMDEEHKEAAKLLCSNVLEKVREHFKAPVIITSGYRSYELNKAIGGSVNSQHEKAEAADIRVLGHSPYEVACWIVEESDIEFDQCIYEYDSWVHVSYTNRYKNRMQDLTINAEGLKGGICV